MKKAETFWAAAVVALTLGASGAAFSSELVSYKVVDGGIPESLTGKAGDVAEGRKTVIARGLGNCLACHQVSVLPDEPFQGDVAPPLDGVADRYTVAELRMLVVNPKTMFPDTVMPAFYKADGLNRVAEKFQGKPILTAQQVEDVVAFIGTLKE